MKRFFALAMGLLMVSGCASTSMADVTVTGSKMGKSDIRFWDGITSTFNRRTTTGGQVPIQKWDDYVDVAQVYGSGSATHAALQAAVSQIATRKAALYLRPGTWTITSSLTVPANLPIVAPAGTTISIASGVTLALQTTPQIGEYGVFTGSGTVTCDQCTDWWADWHQASTGKIKLAAATLAKNIHFGIGTYDEPTGAIYVTESQRLIGSGWDSKITTTASSGYGIFVGDVTRAETTHWPGIHDFMITCSGADAIDCVRWQGTQHALSSNVQITLSSCTNSVGLNMAAGLVDGSDYAAGNFWSEFVNFTINGGSTGDNTALKVWGNNTTWSSGRTNSNFFRQLSIFGGRVGIRFGPAQNSTVIGGSVENQQPGDNSTSIFFDYGSVNNRVFFPYLEPKPSDGSAWTGKTIRCAPYSDDVVAGTSIPNNPTGNLVYEPYWGSKSRGTKYNTIDCYGTNYVRTTNTIFASPPDKSSDANEDGIIDNETTASSAAQNWPFQIRVPGEYGPRIKIGLSGILMTEDNETTGTDMHIWPSDESNHMVLYTGGHTDRHHSFNAATMSNPDVSQGNKFLLSNFNDNSTLITAFAGARGAPKVVFYPYPNNNNLKVDFQDSATDEFVMYDDTDTSDDDVALSHSGTTWTAHFKTGNKRYPMVFECYWKSDGVRQWMLTNRVRSLYGS